MSDPLPAIRRRGRMLAEGQAMSNRRRVLLWVGLLIALAAAGLISALLWTPARNITRASFGRLKPGMTERQAAAVLGEAGRPWEPSTETVRRLLWSGPQGMILLEFERPEDTLRAGYFIEQNVVVDTMGRPPQDFLNRLHRLLGS